MMTSELKNDWVSKGEGGGERERGGRKGGLCVLYGDKQVLII